MTFGETCLFQSPLLNASMSSERPLKTKKWLRMGLIAETRRMAVVNAPVIMTPEIQYYQDMLVDDLVRERHRHLIDVQWRQDN